MRDDLSEIELKSEANSVKNHQRIGSMRKNNLMVTHGNEMYEEQSLGGRLKEYER